MKPSQLLTQEYLEENYIKLGKSILDIQKELNIKSHSSIRQALEKFKIERRPSSQFNEKARINSRNVRWKGYGQISGKYLYLLQNRAKRYNREYTVSPEYLWSLFLKQLQKCALSGINLKFADKATYRGLQSQTASLDRIDSSKGYIEGNVQWVHKDLNCMKMDLSQDKFITWCKLVAERN